MRVLVIGAGALGGYYGACLARAGRDVTFLVRPNRAAQLARTGLHVVSPNGDFKIPAVTIGADEIRDPFDLILLGVKSYSLDEVAAQFAPAVGPNSSILPLLNGVGHVERLRAKFGAGPVLGGVANISAALDAEGRVVHFIPANILLFGEVKGGITDRLRSVEGPLTNAGFDGRASEMVMHDMWEKFVQVATGAGITCLMRASVGDILAAPGGREAIFGLLDECRAVATAAGFPPEARLPRICHHAVQRRRLAGEMVNAARHRTRVDHRG